MATTLSQSGITREAFEDFLSRRQEPDWLTAHRRAAWQTFEDLPLPSRADEEWMRTDIRLFRLDKFSLPLTTHSSPLTASLPSRPARSQYRIVRPYRHARQLAFFSPSPFGRGPGLRRRLAVAR